ncbi:hypothetical protein CHLNCDRAFT_134971 [Chlorella variabilis]|uniref:Protein phosphatase inhibitor n=1 Tax=Chlorella variabilis TaxID=554065 RepID=E1ZH90_CHLVA|nr:hypothetical protein CHLNCDRAFT_134971 [Chlorella variabilis]EFN55081.1 hypothetical protein CHLNCDRAFT_134971 [Chlorella variabilis]|eukprot:XP_005847183.1 hypothetical protein CHLNCDRAFT_134971 [Chlorella variabilis]
MASTLALLSGITVQPVGATPMAHSPSASATHVQQQQQPQQQQQQQQQQQAASTSTHLVLRLMPKKKKKGKGVQWAEDVVDNEFMNKKKSKKCCIFHPQRQFGEWSDNEDSDAECDCPDGACQPPDQPQQQAKPALHTASGTP